jgi:hypothetical protein
LLKQLGGCASKFGLFSKIHTRGGATESNVGSFANFHNDERVVLAGDYIEFAEAASEVAEEYLNTCGFEERDRGALGCLAYFLSIYGLSIHGLTVHVRRRITVLSS